MVRHQNLLVTIAILWLAAIILAIKMQIHQAESHKNLAKHILFNGHNSAITIAYGSHLDNQANLLDLWLPEETEFPHSKAYPLIVFIHGGAWESGDKSFMPYQTPFNSSGYAIASINYRLTREAGYPAQLEDCRTAITWLRSHAKIFKIDPNRIGVWGISAGGHLAALLGSTSDPNEYKGEFSNASSAVQAVCDWAGPTNLATIAEQAGTNYVLSHSVRQFLGGTPEEKPDIAKEASPVNYVHKGCPPFLIMHGQRDTIVPVEQSKELASKLKAVRSNCILEIIPNANHNFVDAINISRVIQFFDLVLKK